MEAFFQSRAKSSNSKASKGGSSNAPTPKKSVPWVEKYRPKSVDDVAHQDEVVSVLKKCVSGGDFPNLLFYGPPGTGKTSAILAVSRELFGVEMMKSRVLELNASDDRGIQVIRDKVKTFSQHAVSSSKPDGSPCPAFKIVILDEADSMTNSAQAALRRTMEKQSKTTRFCLICNYISRIIEPLTSRCTKFRFKPLSFDSMITRLKYVCEREGVKCTDKALDTIIETSEGDMRKAITYVQSSHQLKGGEELCEEDILEIAGVVPGDFINSLLTVCKSNSYDQLQVAVKNILLDGFSAVQTISQVHEHIVRHGELSDAQKSIVCDQIALVDRRLTEGGDELLQLMDLCCVIMTQFCQG